MPPVVQTRNERPLGIDAFMVLPDHVHAMWTLPPGVRSFSARWDGIKARISMSMGSAGFTPPIPIGQSNGGVNPARRRKGEVSLWQPRFWEHHIRDQADFNLHVQYCWNNPVKHGLVKRAVDWPYSSIHRDIRMGLVDDDWTGTKQEGAFGEWEWTKVYSI